MKISDREMIIMVLGYLKGIVGDNKIFVDVCPTSIRNFIGEIEKYLANK